MLGGLKGAMVQVGGRGSEAVVEHEPYPYRQWDLKLCASKPTQRKGVHLWLFERHGGLPYIPSVCEEGDGDVDREVEIWTRKAVCEIGYVD